MERSFDVIIIGLGAMGSAAGYELARRHRRVLGLDRFTPPHTFGSSHGQTRIIREAYFEHPLYVPLVRRAYQRWAELERECGRRLLRQTGGAMIGPPDGSLVMGAQRSAQTHELPHELLTAEEIRRRFPALRPADEMVAVWEPRAGILFPEACIEAQLDLARQRGAALRFAEPVISWRADGAGVQVTTANSTYRAEQLLLTAGPWTRQLLADLSLPLTVERQVICWFEPSTNPEHFHPDRCPINLWEYAPERFFYGFPDLGHGVKAARHHEGEMVEPDAVRREAGPEEVAEIRTFVRRFLPEADGALRHSSGCLYTNTPDSHFLVDCHPRHRQVLIASPCSGHGFKFASAFGEILADLLSAGRSAFDLSPFRLARFAPA
jgi:sarcosine oxidase